MFLFNGQPLSPDVAFTDPSTGVQYPPNWLRLASPQERKAIGIKEVPDPQPYDQRFYFGYDAKGKLIPKDHAQLVEQWTQQVRQSANTRLSPTDWMIIREADNGKAVDPAIKTWREAIRAAAGTKIAAVKATADTDALAAYVTSNDYFLWPADPSMPQPQQAAPEFSGNSVSTGF